MKVAALSRKPWVLALAAGILLTFVSLLYVGFPNGSGNVNISDRPQLRFPVIDLRSEPDDTPWVIACLGMSILEDRGFPASMTSSETGCGDGRDYNVLGFIFNVVFYALLARGIIFAWHKRRR